MRMRLEAELGLGAHTLNHPDVIRLHPRCGTACGLDRCGRRDASVLGHRRVWRHAWRYSVRTVVYARVLRRRSYVFCRNEEGGRSHSCTPLRKSPATPADLCKPSCLSGSAGRFSIRPRGPVRGYSRASREISVCTRLRGGAERTRASNQTVIAETRVNQRSPH